MRLALFNRGTAVSAVGRTGKMPVSRMLFTSIIVALALSSCAPTCKPEIPAGEQAVTKSADLSAIMVIPKTVFHWGDALPVHIIITNTGDKPVTIQPPSGAPAYVSLSRVGRLYTEMLKRYPEFPTVSMSPYTLAPGESRTFRLDLVVGRDWPTHEKLRLVSEISGRNDIAVPLMIMVLPPADEANHMTTQPAQPARLTATTAPAQE